MSALYYFDAPANDNDLFTVLCERFKAACRPGSGATRAERDTLQQQIVDMTRQTAGDALAAAHGLETAIRRSELWRKNI